MHLSQIQDLIADSRFEEALETLRESLPIDRKNEAYRLLNRWRQVKKRAPRPH